MRAENGDLGLRFRPGRVAGGGG